MLTTKVEGGRVGPRNVARPNLIGGHLCHLASKCAVERSSSINLLGEEGCAPSVGGAVNGVDTIESSDACVLDRRSVDVLDESVPILGSQSPTRCVEYGANLESAHNFVQILLVGNSPILAFLVLRVGYHKVNGDLCHLSNLLFESHLGENLLHLTLNIFVGGDGLPLRTTATAKQCSGYQKGCKFCDFHK